MRTSRIVWSLPRPQQTSWRGTPHGFADDALTATLLSTAAPVWVAPAMESRMWQHPATQANVERLRGRGIRFVGPTAGDLASGRSGAGRMCAPEQIVDAVFGDESGSDLDGVTVLITAGPTWEPIDPVRILTNRSTGSMGLALASAAVRRGAEVQLVLGPTHLHVPESPRLVVRRVETAEQMLAAATDVAGRSDVLIATAAVSDFRPAVSREVKLKRSDAGARMLQLHENPDILATVARMLREQNPTSVVVGFAAETNDLVEHARDKLRRKGCDLVIANLVGPDVGFGSNETNVIAVRATGEGTPFGPADKARVAEFVLDQVLEVRRQRAGS